MCLIYDGSTRRLTESVASFLCIIFCTSEWITAYTLIYVLNMVWCFIFEPVDVFSPSLHRYMFGKRQRVDKFLVT